MDIKPTVGRIVHYHTRGSADGEYPPTDFAAIITAVNMGGETPSTVHLCTFGVEGIRFEQWVNQGSAPGEWDWMPFQKDQVARMAVGTASSPGIGGMPNTTSPN